MPSLPNGWRVLQPKPDRACPPEPEGRRRNPERELARLKSRLGVITRRFDRALALRRLRRKAKTAWVALLLIAVGLAVPFVLMKVLSPWPVTTTIRHLAASPNCAAAGAYELAPARRGQPGYWPWHDADDDGVACEPFPHDQRQIWIQRGWRIWRVDPLR